LIFIAVVETILKNEGYEVIVANGKNEAIEKALQYKPD
jgi:CheY-like chemotaxis protein